ncbi:MAG: hypothetical protein DRJ01_14225 [Bacteroidetes bacterium]|nr:MAG: hypothetical protein DRJ01_14225 [Bacteroidota bacterium]
MTDFKITQKINKQSGIANIEIQGSLTIENCDSIKNKFIKAYNNFNELNITLKNIDKIDLTTIQLLYSIAKPDNNTNKKITFNTDFPEQIINLLKTTGLNNIFNNKNYN